MVDWCIKILDIIYLEIGLFCWSDSDVLKVPPGQVRVGLRTWGLYSFEKKLKQEHIFLPPLLLVVEPEPKTSACIPATMVEERSAMVVPRSCRPWVIKPTTKTRESWIWPLWVKNRPTSYRFIRV